MFFVVSSAFVSQPDQNICKLFVFVLEFVLVFSFCVCICILLKEKSRKCFVLSRVCWYHGQIRNFVFTETAKIVRQRTTTGNAQSQKLFGYVCLYLFVFGICLNSENTTVDFDFCPHSLSLSHSSQNYSN